MAAAVLTLKEMIKEKLEGRQLQPHDGNAVSKRTAVT